MGNRNRQDLTYQDFADHFPLVKAVQELSAKVEEQQKTIEALKENSLGKDSKNLNSEDELELFQNNPNPFRKDTEIHMNIPSRVQSAVLFIYDLSGKQIDRLPVTDRGEVIAKIEGGHLAPGMYLYTLIADSHACEAKRMVLTE